MNYFSKDYLIVYVFLLITLVVGWRAGRGIKDIRAYALSNRAFGTAALVLTFLATEVGGQGAINLAGEIGTTGIIVLFTFLSFSLSYIIQALWIAPKLVHFSQCMTMGDIMQTLYGRPSQIIVGIFSFITAICCAGAEIIMLGMATQSLLGIDARIGIVVGGLLLTFYVVHGGIKAVTTTDVLQFLVLLVLLPVLAATALRHAGGIKEVLTHIPSVQLSISDHPKFSYYLVLFLSFGVFHFNNCDPALIQRMLMARSGKQLRQMFLTLAGLFTVIFLVFMLLGTTGHQLYPTLSAAELVPHMIKTLLPEGLRGLMMAGIIAVVMASADSYLHAAGLTLVHDVVKPISDYRAMQLHEIRWVRYITFFAGLLIIGLGLTHGENLYSLLFTSLEFATPLLIFPFFAGILGLKPDRRSFYVSAAVTLSTFAISKLWLPEAHSHFLPLICVVASGLTFFTVHFVRNRGFAVVRRGAQDTDEHLWQPHRQNIATYLRHILPTPQHIVQYSQKQVEKYGAPYILFGAFCCINYTLPYFMWEHDTPGPYNLMLYLRVLGGLTCGLLIVRDKWPKSLLPYLPTFWHFTLLYSLPFTSTVMFLLTQGSVEWLINVAITIMFLIVLVDWVSFILLTVLGVILGFLFYKLTIGPVSLQLEFSTGYLLVYQGIFATLIGLLFARRKQQRFDTLATQQERLILDHQEVNNELLSATEESIRFVNLLKKAGIEQLEGVAHLSKELLAISQQKGDIKDFEKLAQRLTDQLIPMALRMDKFVHRTTGFLLLDGVEKLPLDTFLQKVQVALYDKGYRLKIEVRTQYKTIQWDVEKMKKVIVNSFSFLRSVAGEDTPVLLGIEDTQLGYPIGSVSPDHIKRVTSLRFSITTASTLPKLETLYTAQIKGKESMIKPEAATYLPLLANERIVRAHYGYTSTFSEGDGFTLVYVIPINVREVRSQDMDIPHMKLGEGWPRADDTYPGAQKQEQALLQAVKERTDADLSLVEKAIHLIKDYHGPVMRKSGEPFYLHPLAVAQIVLDYNTDEATVLGALLHDTVEDTPLTLEQIELLFNKEVRTIVSGVTHMESNQETLYKVLLSYPENIHRLLGAEDPRVLYVKLADRMHNMRTIQAKPYKSQRRTAEETLLFFVPLAKYLGLSEAAEELKNRSFGVLGK